MSPIKKITFIILIISGILCSANNTNAQIPDEILISLENGDSKKLSQYFNQNIELVVLEDDNVYSKAQAQQIMSKFFSNNKPESFTVIHQGEGGKEGAKNEIELDGDEALRKDKLKIDGIQLDSNNVSAQEIDEAKNLTDKKLKQVISVAYVIGNLKTNTGSFRIYFLLKSNDGKNYIHQLRIEKQ